MKFRGWRAGPLFRGHEWSRAQCGGSCTFVRHFPSTQLSTSNFCDRIQFHFCASPVCNVKFCRIPPVDRASVCVEQRMSGILLVLQNRCRPVSAVVGRGLTELQNKLCFSVQTTNMFCTPQGDVSSYRLNHFVSEWVNTSTPLTLIRMRWSIGN
jgi:hypothetical protein